MPKPDADDDDSGDDSDEHPHDTSGTAASAQAGPAKRRAVNRGDVLGRYELVEEVGEGGMATVYRARDRELRRDVAVKVMFAHLARRDEVVRRFHREARAAAGLEHPNILRIYDVGAADDTPPYIVMELIRGRTLLAEIEQRGPMLAEMVACIGALLADALGAAHKAGIIHRDIKPANVLAADDGRLLLADFGVARLETEDSLVTRTGALLGTPAYMSPEQASGDTATAKSDLYSLGAMLYQLATGSLPYGGPAARVLAQIAQGSLVAPVRKRASVGPDLSRVIERLMAVESTERPENAAEVARELRALATASGLGDPADEVAAYFADADAFVRMRTPAIVTALVTSARTAIAEQRLPRAIALADRASALAPQDADVAALVQAVTEGGRASRRRRMLAIIGGVIVLATAATGAVLALRGGAATVARDATVVASSTADAPGPIAVPADAAVAEAVVADAALLGDAAPPRPRSHARGPRPQPDALVVPFDAGLPLAIPIEDAASELAPDAALLGAIIVHSDTWCDVTIDGVPHGRNSRAPIAVNAGRHVVVCEKTGVGKRWSQDVDVAAGKTLVVTIQLAEVRITIDVPDLVLDGVPHHRGDVLSLKVGRYEVQVGATKRFIDVRVECTVRGPDFDCYP